MSETDGDNAVSLVTKTNALKRRSVELQTEIETLDEALGFRREEKEI